MVKPDFVIDGPSGAAETIALAHGAGQAMDSPFMTAFAEGLAGHDIRVVRFDFPFMIERRRTGKRGPPDRATVLYETWRMVIEELGAAGLIIGGKSMGGRIASLIADETGVSGLVCLGYPFHPAGRPEKLRVSHLETLRTPGLICQGTRDSLGSSEEVRRYALSPSVRVHWLEDGDHSFTPRKASGRTERQNWDEAIGAVADFAHTLKASGR